MNRDLRGVKSFGSIKAYVLTSINVPSGWLSRSVADIALFCAYVMSIRVRMSMYCKALRQNVVFFLYVLVQVQVEKNTLYPGDRKMGTVRTSTRTFSYDIF